MAGRLRRTLTGAAVTTLILFGAAGVAAQSTVGPSPQTTADPFCDIRTSERVVAIGDVHGASLAFLSLLRANGLVDGDGHWAGGRTILVQLGDLVDRGPDSRTVIDTLIRLEQEASDAGGRVIVLLGNHDVMRMMYDLRYVGTGEFAGFITEDSPDIRTEYYDVLLSRDRGRAEAAGQTFDEDAFRERFLEQVPLGFVESLMAFEPNYRYGAWLRSHRAMARINDVAFVHAGLTARTAALGCAGINAGVAEELQDLPSIDDPAGADTLVAGPAGPLWSTWLVDDTAPPATEEVADLLDGIGVRALVVGHALTPERRIRTLHGGRVIQIDTGMLGGTEFPGGRPSALEILDGTISAIYADRRDVLVELDALGPQ